MLYADCNSGRALYPEVKEKIISLLSQDLANPSLVFSPQAQNSRAIIQEARENIALLIDCEPEEVVFTSGGTESCFHAIMGSFLARASKDKIVTSALEHPAVLKACNTICELAPIKQEIIASNLEGEIFEDHFINKIDSQTFLVNLMGANNETGICFPWQGLAQYCTRKNILFHCDMTQWIGRLPFSFKKSKIDLVSFSSHKIGGPQGVGALIVKAGVHWQAPMPGGGQELGRRGGTEPVALIAGFGLAAKIRQKQLKYENDSSVRDYLESKLNHVQIVGKNQNRLPNTSMFILEDVAANDLVQALAKKGMIVSSGAACSQGSGSKVLAQMGYSERQYRSAVRVSFLHEANLDQGKLLAGIINEEIIKIREKNIQELNLAYER